MSIVSKLFSSHQPSYLSFEYALAKYNILPEMPYQITSATSKPTRTFNINNKIFSYLKIKTKSYTGYRLERDNDQDFLIAEPEKALVDYLYFVVLGKKPAIERLNVSSLNKEKLARYADLYEREKLKNLIKNL